LFFGFPKPWVPKRIGCADNPVKCASHGRIKNPQRCVERVLKIRIGIFVHLLSPVFALRQQQPVHGEPPFGPTFSWQNQSGTQSFLNLQNVALGIRQVQYSLKLRLKSAWNQRRTPAPVPSFLYSRNNFAQPAKLLIPHHFQVAPPWIRSLAR